jgi:hypothetical protein
MSNDRESRGALTELLLPLVLILVLCLLKWGVHGGWDEVMAIISALGTR